MDVGEEETSLNLGGECTTQATIVINTLFVENARPALFLYECVAEIYSAAARLKSKIAI